MNRIKFLFLYHALIVMTFTTCDMAKSGPTEYLYAEIDIFGDTIRPIGRPTLKRDRKVLYTFSERADSIYIIPRLFDATEEYWNWNGNEQMSWNIKKTSDNSYLFIQWAETEYKFSDLPYMTCFNIIKNNNLFTFKGQSNLSDVDFYDANHYDKPSFALRSIYWHTPSTSTYFIVESKLYEQPTLDLLQLFASQVDSFSKELLRAPDSTKTSINFYRCFNHLIVDRKGYSKGIDWYYGINKIDYLLNRKDIFR